MKVVKIIVEALIAGCFLSFIATPINAQNNIKGALDLTTDRGALEARTIKNSSRYGNSDFDIEAKRRQVEALVYHGADFIKSNPIDKALSAFTHGKDFTRGELYIFVYNIHGVALAHGQESNLVWKNLYDLKDPYGTYIVRSAIAKAQEGGGWFTYNWRGATKVAFVQQVVKDGKHYIIGSGYYPHSKPDTVVSLVKGATAYFNDVVNKQGGEVDAAFSTLSYPFGRFVYGDLYLYAVKFDGTMMANGDRPGLIGINVINQRDSDGRQSRNNCKIKRESRRHMA